MELSLLESILYGFFSGLTDILPVSSAAHGILMRKLFGVGSQPALLGLLIHIAVLAALYHNCQSQILKILRARRLARIPRRQRKRPLDTKSLMDLSLWKTMLVPIILAFFFYRKAAALGGSLLWVAAFLFGNGLILYIPQFLPGSNKDSRMLSRVEGLLMGLGGAVSVFPGISAIGAASSVASVCGVDRDYGFQMGLFLNLAVNTALIVYDCMDLFSAGLDSLTFAMLVQSVLAAAAAFGGVTLALRVLKHVLKESSLAPFAYYCWGGALFMFILNLMA